MAGGMADMPPAAMGVPMLPAVLPAVLPPVLCGVTAGISNSPNPPNTGGEGRASQETAAIKNWKLHYLAEAGRGQTWEQAVQRQGGQSSYGSICRQLCMASTEPEMTEHSATLTWLVVQT